MPVRVSYQNAPSGLRVSPSGVQTISQVEPEVHPVTIATIAFLVGMFLGPPLLAATQAITRAAVAPPKRQRVYL